MNVVDASRHFKRAADRVPTPSFAARYLGRTVLAIGAHPDDIEAKESAAILGSEPRILLEGACRRIEDLKNYQLVGLLDALVRDAQPAAVLTHGPTDFHHDHVTVYHATVAAQRVTQFDLFSYVPTMTRPVPVPFEPNAYVDISSTMDRKLEAIAAHKSQFYSRGLAFEFYRDLAKVTGRMVGVEYAEALAVDKIVFA